MLAEIVKSPEVSLHSVAPSYSVKEVKTDNSRLSSEKLDTLPYHSTNLSQPNRSPKNIPRRRFSTPTFS